jgi:RNA polymerase sigma factor (sigma-70 family)
MARAGGGHADRFRLLYDSQFRSILGYALRRVAAPEDAADVVSETFLVAWRRMEEVPAGDGARPWLYGVARRVLANQHRSQRRRDSLGDRLRAELSRQVVRDRTTETAEVDLVRRAMSRLGEVDCEVLRLSVWEGLEPREIAVALDLSPEVVRTRLSRARARLRRELGRGDLQGLRPDRHDPPGRGHVVGVRAATAPKEER